MALVVDHFHCLHPSSQVVQDGHEKEDHEKDGHEKDGHEKICQKYDAILDIWVNIINSNFSMQRTSPLCPF